MTKLPQQKIIPVVLCGGSGTRLWPLSRDNAPKQFHTIVGEKSLLNDTLNRALKCSSSMAADVITVTADSLKRDTMQQLADFDPKSMKHLVSEPLPRNTAAAIAYAALYANKHFDANDILWILPSDHYVENESALAAAVNEAAAVANEGYIVTFGMQPTRPETGYGYIKVGPAMNGGVANSIAQFVEKPDAATAQDYVASGEYLWNSGMFVGSISTIIDNFKQYCPEIFNPLDTAMSVKKPVSAELYSKLPSMPFDIAIMEKTRKSAVVPCNIGWSDVGSWESVWELRDKDENGNVIKGNVEAVETENCLIQSNSMLIATIGLKDLVIVENNDTVFIADKHNNTALKGLVNGLKQQNRSETIFPPMEKRPWGEFKVLSHGVGYKIKEIIVKPGQKLSLQMHNHRCEFWTVIEGEAVVTINDTIKVLKKQENVFIPLKASHRMENKGEVDLKIVEVQCGDYLGEDDIIRFDDIYGRVEAA